MIVNKLTFIEYTARRHSNTYAKYKCFCGKIFETRKFSVTSGKTKSCGCYGRQTGRTHGFRSNGKLLKEYRIWRGIINRCESSKNKDFKWYGGAGIKICQSWRQSFVTFYTDMGPIPSNKHSIDRIDSKGNYKPSNCRWVTIEGQIYNKQNTVKLEGLTTKEFCTKYSLPRSTVYGRLYAKWEIDDIKKPKGYIRT